MSFRLVFALVFAVTLLIYGTMLFSTLPAIVEGAGGLAPFDMRPLGYSTQEAHAFLSALTPAARETYLGPQQTLDLFYPTVLAVTLSLAFWRLRAGILRVIGIVFAIAGAAADYLENAAVKSLLLAQELPDAAGIARASGLTVAKSSATTLALVLLLILWVVRLLQQRKMRRQRSAD